PREAGTDDRGATGELSPTERNDELPDRHDRPAPDEDAADGRQAEREEREDARGRRDVAEGDREGAEDAERAAQLLLVAELREVGLVARGLGRRLVVDVQDAVLAHASPSSVSDGRLAHARRARVNQSGSLQSLTSSTTVAAELARSSTVTHSRTECNSMPPSNAFG